MAIFTHFYSLALLTALLCASITCAAAADVRVAVASNFVTTARVLALLFTQQTGHTLVISSASTGKHFAHIRNGAPFDLFLAADSARPMSLEDQGDALPNSRFTYAVGKLVLWSASRRKSSLAILQNTNYKRLAIANPRHAPYGLAAQQVLQKLDLWSSSQSKLLRAENVTQAFQFVATQNADLGFASLVQIKQLQLQHPKEQVSYWLVSQDLYSPIEQQAVVLRDSQAAREFVAFIQSDRVQQIIRDHGYGTL